jgi:hypothetical protein
MIVAVGLHRVDEAQLIGMLGRMGHQFADPHPRFPILLERKGALEDHIVATVKDIGVPSRIQCVAKRSRNRLSIEPIELGFVIVSVDLGGATDHEQEND